MTQPAEKSTTRRRFPRIRSRQAILATRLDGSAVEDLGATSSIGLGGCGFVSHESFGKGASLQLLISIGHEVVKATARVVYEERLDDATYEIGAEFVTIAPADLERIEAFVEYPAS